ncbi:MAG TPA: HEAT repeat domain-containing protein [Ktedonobacteraceae bacterium]|nr:HEAT repeat domain-containing protein [Ktedonobacteraceae bacterium]
MTSSDSSSDTTTKSLFSSLPSDTAVGETVTETPPVGVTPPQILARQAAEGSRGAAWRLLYWIMEDDPRAVIAVSSLEDDRLARHLLEFIALGTWAGKPFVIPPPLRTPHARTRLRTLFLPGSGIESARAQLVLRAGANDPRPAVRETAIHILGIIGNPAATPILIEALHDPVPSVRLQAAKALGRAGDESAVPALLSSLSNADEQLGSQIFASLVHLGNVAVPGLIDASASSSAWMRWHAIRALGEICDQRALPVLVQALLDNDHSVAWMGAKGLTRFGRQALGPLLRLLMNNETTPWLVETASYVLDSLMQRDSRLKEYLEPVVQYMHGVAYRVGTPTIAQKALTQLTVAGLIGPRS